MGLNSLGLGFVFTARDLASNTMRKVGANFNVMSRQTARGAKDIGAAAVTGAAGLGLLIGGAGALGSAYSLANRAGEFEMGVAKVAAISRASAEDLKRLSDAAKQAGIDTQFSPTEATEGLANLASQGFNATESIKTLVPALDLAAGGQIGIAEAAATTAAAVKVFGLSVDEAGLATDQLLRISNVTALKASDLELALGTVSRGAIAAKQSIEEMLPAMGLVKNSGVDASVAASSVSSALLFIAKNADEFEKLGVKVTDAEGKWRPFLDIVMETEGKLSGITNEAKRTAKATELFGKFGLTAFTTISNQLNTGIKNSNDQLITGQEAVDFLRATMHDAGGAAAEFREKLLATFEGQKVLLQGVMQTLGVEMGETFAQTFKPIVAAVREGATAMIKFVASIPGPVKDAIGKVILFFGALLTTAGVGLIVSSIFTALAGAAGAIATALALATGAFAAIGLVIGAGVLMWRGYTRAMYESEQQTNVFTRAFSKIKLAMAGVWAVLTGNPISKEVADDLKRAENEGVFKFVQSVGRLMIRLEKLWDGMRSGFDSTMEAARPVFKGLFAAFEKLGKALGFVGDAFDSTASTSKEAWFEAGFRIGEMVAHVLLSFVHAATAIVNAVTWIIDHFDQIWGSVKLGVILFATFKASVIAFRVGVVALNVALVALRAIKVAWLWITNAQNLAMLRLNGALLISALRAKAVAVAVGILRGVKAVWAVLTSGQVLKLTALNLQLLIMRARSMAAAAATGVLSGAGGIKGLLGGLLGKAGLVAAAAAAGYAFGSWLDETFKLSDGIADLLADVTGLNAELEKLDERNGGRTNKRGGAVFLDTDGKPLSPEENAKVVAEMKARRAGAVDPANVQRERLNGTLPAQQPGKPDAKSQQAEFVAALKEAGLSGKEIAQALRSMPPTPIAVDGQVLGTVTARGSAAAAAREYLPVGVEG